MARGRKKRNRIRAKRFETEIITTCNHVFEGTRSIPEQDSSEFQSVKGAIGKLIKRLLDQKLLREQEFYLGDWVFSAKDKSTAAMEVIDVNYSLRTVRIRDKTEGEIWVRFNDIVKDDEFYYL
jgi:hypothetical protein